MRVWMHAETCRGMCVGMCVDVCVGMCAIFFWRLLASYCEWEIYMHVYGCVYGRVYRRV